MFLVATLVIAILVLLFAFWLGGQQSRVSRAASVLLFAATALSLFVVGLAFTYPHNLHDTEWVPGRYAWNYGVDFALGLVLWSVVVFAWLRWRRVHHRVRPDV
jgi:formate-dependent nitrite reductase membrane component NrfD